MASLKDAEVLGPVPFGSVIVFRGVPAAEQAQLRADIEAATEHSKFVVVFLDAKGGVRLNGSAEMHKAMVATLADEIVTDLADRAEAIVVNKTQPVLALLQEHHERLAADAGGAPFGGTPDVG